MNEETFEREIEAERQAKELQKKHVENKLEALKYMDSNDINTSEIILQNETSILFSLERWDHIQSLDIKIEWIIDRLIPKESITLVFGKGGIGKTWLLMDMARCIGEGIHYLGLTTIKTPVIFVDFENPLAVLNTRTQKLGDSQNVYFWRANNEKIKPPKLDSADWEDYKKLPKGAVLIFDTLRASHGQDENKSDGMALIMERMKELRDMCFTIILLHHTAKNSDKIAKGSTAIVDLSDHILGLTLVRKKKGGQDIVIDDDEDDEDTVYKFGVREKTRFEPYHIYLILNPDYGFELAPDPQVDTLKEMHRILLENDSLTKSAFIERCKGLGIGINKLRKLVELGQSRYWKIGKGDKHTYLVSPIQLVNSTPHIGGVGLTNYKDTPKNTPVELDSQNSLKALDNTKLVNSTEGVYPINQLNLMEGVI
ncbi:MAG: AAA family ATPase [Nitrospinae bacterium]|nr:AAA family ATPase [Nitrospinota bacterium]